MVRLQLTLLLRDKGMKRVAMFVVGLFIAGIWGPAVSAHDAREDGREGLNATLWMQKSHEYAYSAEQVFRAATARLPAARWHGDALIAPERSARPRSRRPAIVVDLDETVLDNSPFQAEVVQRNRYYKPSDWDAWVAREAAGLIPGAKPFLLEAKRRGFRIFYVTNRECDRMTAPTTYPHPDCPARVHTLATLSKLGLPFSDDPKALLLRFDQRGWETGKSDRRAFIGTQHRVALILGDDLGDFLPVSDVRGLHDSIAANQRVTEPAIVRSSLYQAYLGRFGMYWFLLPNPTYGSWELSLGFRPVCQEKTPPIVGDECYEAALEHKRSQLVLP